MGYQDDPNPRIEALGYNILKDKGFYPDISDPSNPDGVSNSNQSHSRTPRDGGYGGCNSDAFSVFGFLAFLLAAANLFMSSRRRKRSM